MKLFRRANSITLGGPAIVASLTLAASLSLGLLLAPHPTHAATASLQLNPLKYEDTLTGSHVRNGYIDVSNPTDATLEITASVRGFKQADLDGNLDFFDDAALRAGVTLGLDHFTLGPRESIRVSFSVDPTKLPRGGVYGAIFFRTVPPASQPSNTSFISDSANVGSLLLLQNGGAGEHIGRITRFDLPWLQTGPGLHGQFQYQNNNRTTAPIAFTPTLASHVLPWGHPARFAAAYVLPGSTRQSTFTRPGSYLGLLPVTLTDTASGASVTRWVIACTGWYSFVLLNLLILALPFVLIYLLRRRTLRQARTTGYVDLLPEVIPAPASQTPAEPAAPVEPQEPAPAIEPKITSPQATPPAPASSHPKRRPPEPRRSTDGLGPRSNQS